MLFWWMQRRFSLLLGLTGILILVFAVALGVAGWLYGELSIMALSSIEILIGLAVDYGLVICQEAKVAGHDRKALLRACGKPVAFGALTTTVVFLALNLGGLPGMAQLGSIVAIGLMRGGHPDAGGLSAVRREVRCRSRTGARLRENPAARQVVVGDHRRPVARRHRHFARSTACRKPSSAPKIMRPRNSEAMETFEHIQKAFPAYGGKSLGLVIEAGSDAEMLARLTEARHRIDAAYGIIGQATLPDGWWPDAARQTTNRPVLADSRGESRPLAARGGRRRIRRTRTRPRPRGAGRHRPPGCGTGSRFSRNPPPRRR